MTRTPFVAAFLLATACGTGDPAGPTPRAADADQMGAERPTSKETSGGLEANCAGGDEGAPVPATPEALNAWLQKRAYMCWARESRAHASAGPHSGNVRVYLNAALDRSLSGFVDGREHPVGSVAVKELFHSSPDVVSGWAVGVKTQATSQGGDGWYWYEVFSATPGDTSAIQGQGKDLCSSCHAAGRDFVLITYPLR